MYVHHDNTTISEQLKHLEMFSDPIKPYGVIYNPVNHTDITDEIKNKYVVRECEAVKHNYFIILQRGDISKENELKPTKDLINDIVGFDVSTIKPLPEYKKNKGIDAYINEDIDE